MQDSQYSVSLPKFEGSLDLLLHLIRSNKIDIYDIPIAFVTKQYLEYLDMMKELDLDIASDFIVMASTLIFIKSRMLLPPTESEECGESADVDPRTPLVERLLEYQTIKEASHLLRELEGKRQEKFSRPCMEGVCEAAEDFLFLPEASIFDLMEAVKKILQKLPSEASEISRETLTVKDRIALIIDKIEEKSAVAFHDFFGGQETRLEIIVTFIALLEIIKMNIAKAFQHKEFGSIWIFKCSSEDRMSGTSPI